MATIIENDIDLYTGGKENALRRLRNCHPDEEHYWKALALKYNDIVTQLMELNEMFKEHQNIVANRLKEKFSVEGNAA